MAGETLLIRADATTRMGTGHVMRCLALAQAWQAAGGQAALAAVDLDSGLESRLAAEGVDVRRLAAEAGSARDARDTAAMSRELGAAWLAVDGYQFGAAYQQALKKAGASLLFVDDYGHANHYHADLVLNQNIQAREALYPRREPHTRLLLGPRYALLRREFWPWRGRPRTIRPEARRVLVTLGGSDPDNVALKVLAALGQIAVDGLQGLLILGSSNPHEAALRQAIEEMGIRVRVEQRVTSMPEHMAWADVCVAAGGGTAWELALMGLPGLLFVLAANQQANAEGLHAAGVAHNLGWHGEASPAAVARELERVLRSPEVRSAMAGAGQHMVDGYGAQRVATTMTGRAVVRVRPAGAADARRIFDWANDPVTRAMSFHPDPISWTEHEGWFRRVTSDPGVLLFIAEVEEGEGWAPCGQVRIDEDGTVSLAIAPRHRGRGLAVPALRAAVAHAGQRGHRELTAYVKPENERSRKVFSEAGFDRAGQTEVRGQLCLRYIYRDLPAAGSNG